MPSIRQPKQPKPPGTPVKPKPTGLTPTQIQQGVGVARIQQRLDAIRHIPERPPVSSQLNQGKAHLAVQAGVGGTKGKVGVVDRSLAVKRSWDTRRKIYGTSGRKGK